MPSQRHPSPARQAAQDRLAAHVEQILDTPGCYMVIGVPGSAKTGLLVQTIQEGLDRGIDRDAFLVITYQKKTVDDINNRIKQATGLNELAMTLHAWGYSVIREHHGKVGYPSPPTAIDDSTQYKLLRDAYQSHLKGTDEEKEVDIVRLYRTWRQTGRPLDQLFEDLDISDDHKNIIRATIQGYRRQKKSLAEVDFHDMVKVTEGLLRSDPKLLSEVTQPYQYMLVDEVQDLNRSQLELLLLLQPHIQTCVFVGDPCQSIYRFQGAHKDPFGLLKHRLPKVIEIMLNESLRLPLPIVKLANTMRSDDVEIITHKTGRRYEKPLYLVSETRRSQYLDALEVIRKYQKHGLQRIAIVARYSITLTQMSEHLHQHGIPHTLFEKAVEDKVRQYLQDFLKTVLDPSPETLAAFLEQFCRLSPEIAQKCVGFLSTRRIKAKDVLTKVQHSAVKAWLDAIARCRSKTDPVTLVNIFGNHARYLPADGVKPKILRQKLEKLRLEAVGQHTVANYVDRLVQLDGEHADAALELPSIVLSTIHASKGITYDGVVVLDVYDGSLPAEQNRGDETALQQEKNLLFVAMTRCSRALALLTFQHEECYQREGDCRVIRERRASPFIEEIEPLERYCVIRYSDGKRWAREPISDEELQDRL